MLKFKKSAELTGHAGAVYCLAPGRSNHTFFSGAADGFIAEWNANDAQPEKFSVKLNSPVFSMAHCLNKSILATGLFNGHLHFIDLKERKELRNFQINEGGIFSLSYNANSNILYSGSQSGVFRAWNMNELNSTIALPLNDQKIREINCDEKNDLILVSSGSGELIILEPDYFNEMHRLKLHEGGVNSAFIKDELIFSAGKDGHIRISSLHTGKNLESVPAHNYGIYRIKPVDENHFITCSRDKTVKVWNYTDLTAPLRLDFKNFKGHTHSVNDLLVLHSNNSIISCGDDKKIIVWKV